VLAEQMAEGHRVYRFDLPAETRYVLRVRTVKKLADPSTVKHEIDHLS
jgi:hypothetical protein